jgi:hypothetical protein
LENSDLSKIGNIKKFIFNRKHDTISSKLMAKQQGVTRYIGTPGVLMPIF